MKVVWQITERQAANGNSDGGGGGGVEVEAG